jgi:quercetin dioxygenase-like cupin family protein
MCNLIEELSNQADLENDPRWMSSTNEIKTLLLMLDITHGDWVILVKAKAGSVMPVHYHPKPLYVFTVYGHWYYPEHKWHAKTGHFLYEVPGELHTPTFIEDTLLYSVVTGPIIYPGKNSEADKITDVYTHFNALRQHYQRIGLGEDEIKKIIR